MAGAAPASLGARQDLLDTSPVLRAELQLRAASCTAHNSLPPPEEGGILTFSLPYGSSEGGFQWRGANIQDVHLGKARVNTADLHVGKEESVLQAGKGQRAGRAAWRAQVSLDLLLSVTKQWWDTWQQAS